MKRREFLVGGASMAWPLTAVAQSRKPATLGISRRQKSDPTQLIKGIKEGLRDLGYVEGTNIVFELHIGGADAGDLMPLAAELVARKVDILSAYPIPAATAIEQATKSIPIVILSADPVALGWWRASPGPRKCQRRLHGGERAWRQESGAVARGVAVRTPCGGAGRRR